MYLSGHTPAPIDRFGRVQKDIAKTALGAERILSWGQSTSPYGIIAKLKKDGWMIVGVEQDTRAIDYRKFSARGGSSSGGKLKKPTLFIFGNEVRGISPALRAKCGTLIEIPMHGSMVRQAHHPRHTKRGKESLNVSVSAGIVLFTVSS